MKSVIAGALTMAASVLAESAAPVEHNEVVIPKHIAEDVKHGVEAAYTEHLHHLHQQRSPAAHGFLNPHDPVAITFWIISIAMVASTVFFLMESQNVAMKWRTSMNVGALVTLIAAVHYFYMREFWVIVGTSPIVYRYIDWSLTVPLQMIEFYLILSAVNPNISGGIFWRLLIGTVLMLGFGYAGESKFVNPFLGFCVGMCGWFFILGEIFVGEAGKLAGANAEKAGVNEYVKKAFGVCRFIVTVGWCIYPLGYFFGYLLGSVSDESLNLLYNVADFVNKIAFCLAIWHAAKGDTLAQAAAAGQGYKAI